MLEFITYFLLPTIVMIFILFTFVMEDSTYQKYRLRCAIDKILSYIQANTRQGSPYCSLDIIYRNKEFKIGIIVEEPNYYYKRYRIFINGDEVAEYHSLMHTFIRSYHFRNTSKRYDWEIRSIIFSGYKHLKRREKAMYENINTWSKYSYFE